MSKLYGMQGRTNMGTAGSGEAGSNKQEHSKLGFLFLHGAGLRGDVWSEVAEGIGAPCLLANLPLRSGSHDDRKRLGLDDYAQAIAKQVEAWGQRRFIIVAHSIGGVLALKLCRELGDRVAGLVAVGAAIPSEGGSFLSALPLGKRMLFSGVLALAGTKPPASAIRAGLCNDLTAEQSDDIVRSFVPEAVSLYREGCGAAAPLIPSLYLKLLQDKEFPFTLQERMARRLHNPAIVELETGHLPMLGNPAGLRSALLQFRDSLLPA